MGRPSKGQRVSFTVRLDAELVARVDAFASEAGADRSSALAELVALGLGDGVRAAERAEAVAAGVQFGASPVVPGSRLKPNGPKARAKPSASAPVQAAASAVASIAPTVRARPPRLIGWDAVTGAPIYREG